MKFNLGRIAGEFAEETLVIKRVYLRVLKSDVYYPKNDADDPIAVSGLPFATKGKATFAFDDGIYRVEGGKVLHGRQVCSLGIASKRIGNMRLFTMNFRLRVWKNQVKEMSPIIKPVINSNTEIILC